MTLPGWRDWVFSAKTFAGAMLALWLAFWLDLDRPYWAMATAYIVANPVTGAMRSKSAYRFAGTLIGAVATLALVPNLVDAPELLVAALALWVAFCIYFALLDRTPRSYLFLLAGFTAALIGFPAVDTPGAIWDIVLARVEEITLGIACSTLVGTLILPVPLGPALAKRVDTLLREAATCSLALLSGLPDSAASRAARRKLAADALEIGGLAAHLAYDTSSYQSAAAAVSVVHRRVILLLAVLSGVADRIAVLRENGGLTADIRAGLDRVSAWLAAPERSIEDADALRASLVVLDPPADAQADWNAVMISGLLSRLLELVDIGHDMAALRGALHHGDSRLPHLVLPSQPGPRHRDHFMAAYSGAAAALAIGLISAFWIAAAWPEGSGAASLAAVACSFFAAQDDPVPSLVKFIYGVTFALVVDAIYLFAILPRAHDFEMLALALAAFYVPLGALMAQPKLAQVAGPIAFVGATLMSLSSSYSADFASFTNGAVAAVGGLAAAAVILRLVRSVGANWAAQRLLRANRADIADAASHAGAEDRLIFASLMLDRLGELVPRLAAVAEGADAAALSALAEIRVGINVVDLQHAAAGCTQGPAESIRTVLGGVAAHFRAPPGTPPAADLLVRIDHAIEICGGAGGAQRKAILLALAGLRRALFADAPPYAPRPAPLPTVALAA